KLVQSIRSFAERTVLPGSFGLTISEVSVFFFKQVSNTQLNDRSAAATFNFLMALPPTLLFLFSLIPYLPLDDVQQTIRYAIFIITPSQNIQESITGVIDDFMDNERRDLLSFGVILTLFFSSNGMMGLMRSFDRMQDMYVERTGLKRRWTALKLTVMLLIVAIISIAALILQSRALNGIILQFYDNIALVKIISFLILVAVIFFSICIIYKYGPSLRDRFRFISPGAFFATFLIIIATALFFFLVDNFLNYNKVYGPIGTLIAFMVWIRINTLVLLLGFELNVSILMGKTKFIEDI